MTVDTSFIISPAPPDAMTAPALTAASLGIPEQFNAAVHFVDRNVAEGRGDRIAIEDGDDRLTYADVLRDVNRTGNALRRQCDVRPEERVLLLLLDGPAFWLYSSGSTGPSKGCVHLQHDMVMCAELFGKGILGIGLNDRCFSVAKLFFAYGLGNALYFPFSVGATAILWPGPPTPQNVYAVIERHRPTLFSSVP